MPVAASAAINIVCLLPVQNTRRTSRRGSGFNRSASSTRLLRWYTDHTLQIETR